MFSPLSPCVRGCAKTWKVLPVQQLPLLLMPPPATSAANFHCGGALYKCKREKKHKTTLTAVLRKVDDLKLEHLPLPKIGAGDVILAIDCVGICGSDVHYWKQGYIGSFVLNAPMVIGHEASGVVVCAGKGVHCLKVGDRVAIEPGVPCRLCPYCKSGAYNLCPKMRFCATPPVDGLLTQYFRHAADFCYRIPDRLTMEEGALMEPLSVAVAACRRAKVQVGMNVLILGSGPIGLLTMLVAKASGASQVMMTDVNCHRLNLAKDLGATHTMLTCPGEQTACLAKQIKDTMGGGLPHRTIDCCGSSATVRLGLSATRDGGVCCLIGLHSDVVPLTLTDAIAREVDIVGSFRYRNDYMKAVMLASSGKLPIKKLITHHFPMEDTVKAFEAAHKQAEGTVKVMIHVQKPNTNNPTPF